MNQNLVVGLYYHPEAFPPTLNAIGELSHHFKTITLVFRPHLKGNWQYPPNIRLVASGDFISSHDQEEAPTLKKLFFFLHFVYDLFKKCRQARPSVILVYDPIALFAYYLIRPFLFFKHKLWYHNHDIAEIARLKKYSIGWLSSKAEQSRFATIDIFTLPAEERLVFFPIEKLKGSYFIVPNYPSLSFYSQFYQSKKTTAEIKLIFQGRIDEGHGFEEILPLLNRVINGKKLLLVLKGFCGEAYKHKLLSMARTMHVHDKIIFFGFTPYREVPQVASGCHIGIGIFSKKEVMHITLGTASNKIYEYAALGLPVLYNKEEYFEKYLGKYNWAFPVEVNTECIGTTIAEIDKNYEYYSHSAEESFRNELNFEHCFAPVIRHLSIESVISLSSSNNLSMFGQKL